VSKEGTDVLVIQRRAIASIWRSPPGVRRVLFSSLAEYAGNCRTVHRDPVEVTLAIIAPSRRFSSPVIHR